MMRSMALRGMLGRSSGKRLLYLGAALATHAWLKRMRAARAGRLQPHARDGSPGASEGLGQDAVAAGRGGAGITDLPPDAEHAQQSSLPPRGTRKEEFHA